MSFPEGPMIDAVVRQIEARASRRRSLPRRPECDPSEPFPIDYLCNVGPDLFAIEHTRIEPFEDYHRLIAKANELVQPIIQGVRGRLPTTANYELTIPATALVNIRNQRRLAATQTALVEWVVSEAPRLKPIRHSMYDMGSTPQLVEQVGIRVSLMGYLRPQPGGTLTVAHGVGKDREKDRADRISRAYSKKLKKLLPWKQRGARTILILEDGDMHISNQYLIAHAVEIVEGTFSELPDDVFLISTFLPEEWYLHLLRRGNHRYRFLNDRSSAFAQVNPKELSSLE